MSEFAQASHKFHREDIAEVVLDEVQASEHDGLSEGDVTALAGVSIGLDIAASLRVIAIALTDANTIATAGPRGVIDTFGDRSGDFDFRNQGTLEEEIQGLRDLEDELFGVSP